MAVYRHCLECGTDFSSLEEIVRLHEESIDWVRPPVARVRAEKAANSFCPLCLHDWAFPPNEQLSLITDQTLQPKQQP